MRHPAYTIRLAAAGVAPISATLDCEVRFRDEGGFRVRSCTVKLRSDRYEVEGEGHDFFDAFCRVREALASEEVMPLCYGASRNVFPSGMDRDMGDGLSAYKLRMGEPARREDHIFSIFADGPDVEPASVAAQREFFEAWLQSTGRRPVA